VVEGTMTANPIVKPFNVVLLRLLRMLKLIKNDIDVVNGHLTPPSKGTD